MKIVDVGAGPRLFLISDFKLLAMFLKIFYQQRELGLEAYLSSRWSLVRGFVQGLF